jgi:curved DNA-binding protein CbpA
MTPFELLSVKPASPDREVKDAYLRMVRKYPPETHPAQFRLLSDAYSRIDTEAKRLDSALFSLESPLRSPLDILSKRFLFWERKPMDKEGFQNLFRSGAANLMEKGKGK